MKKISLSLAAALCGTLLHAQTLLRTDSLNMLTDSLSEVTVRASRVIRKSDRQIVFPSNGQKERSVNGLDLTQRLSLPRVFVNVSQGSIGMSGGETLQLRINGVEATPQEVQALSPADIRRVEYHDNPGLRYGEGVGAVIDYITVRHTSGGNVGTSLLQQANSIGADQVYGTLHYGRSQFGFSYYTNFHFYNDIYTDEKEEFHFPDGSSLFRMTDGTPGKNGEILHQGSATYRYTADDNFMFSAKFSLLKYDVGTALHRGEVYNLATPACRISRERSTPHWWNRPSLDVYLFRKLKNSQSIALDVVATYNGNHQKSSLRDICDEEIYTDLQTDVRSKRISFITEAIYEKAWGTSRLVAGLKHTQAKTDNTYRGDTQAETRARDADTYGYAEFIGKTSNLTYTLGLGLARTHISQQGFPSLNRWNFRPTLKLLYAFNEVYSLRFRYLLRNVNPGLSQLSDVEQPTDSLQLLRGNPLLNSNLRHTFGLNLDMNRPAFQLGLSLLYGLQHRPVMEETGYDASRRLFVKTYANQRRFETLNAELYANLSFWKDHVNLYFSGGINHFISTGRAYRHRYTDFYYISQLQADYKNFLFTAQFIRQENRFYGETATPWNRYNQFQLGYKFRNNIRLDLGVMNPFGEFCTATSRNYSALAGSTKTTHYPNLKRCLLVSFSWNLDFGKQYKSLRKKIENSDSESGILK